MAKKADDDECRRPIVMSELDPRERWCSRKIALHAYIVVGSS